MAEADETKEQEQADEPKAQEGEKKSFVKGLLSRMTIPVVILVFAGAGFGLGRFFAGPAEAEAADPNQKNQPNQMDELKADGSAANSQKNWYYETLDTVIANLDEPGVTRYVRVTLILEMNPEVDQKKGTVFIDEKKHIITNWLNIFLASLSLEDIRGDRNLRTIQSRIRDSFNEILFPDNKPQIEHILFKEFAVQ